MSTGRNTATRDQHRAAIRRTKPPCGICEQAIDYSLPHLNPMAYVVDHIIPLNKGGLDVLENKQAAHRGCNRTKSDKLDRRVLLICGPPGAGKSTLAHQSGLPVFDVDDPQWSGNESLFKQALTQMASSDAAQAAVIRSAATLSARQAAANLVGANEIVVLTTDLETCIERIKGRNRPGIKRQIAAAQDWWRKYEPGDIGLTSSASVNAPRSFVTSRSW